MDSLGRATTIDVEWVVGDGKFPDQIYKIQSNRLSFRNSYHPEFRYLNHECHSPRLLVPPRHDAMDFQVSNGTGAIGSQGPNQNG